MQIHGRKVPVGSSIKNWEQKSEMVREEVSSPRWAQPCEKFGAEVEAVSWYVVRMQDLRLHPCTLSATLHRRRGGLIHKLGCEKTDVERKLTLCSVDIVNADCS